ncbi:MAG: hypothetical protein J6R01_04475 [Alistipes sp.]|nr:hypothetical protein [Alistipes sp.]
MDSKHISDKRYLFAYGITDGALDDMSEEERTAMIIDITEIKEAMLKAGDNTPNEFK